MTLLASDGATYVGTGAVVATLVTAFGYALTLLSKGTDRIDKSSLAQVRAAEAERDRAREDARAEVERIRDSFVRQLADMERERDYWRNRCDGHADT